MDNKKSYVYKIMCKITGEYYFGSSFNANSDYYWGKGRKIKELISKYGKENFVKEILGEFEDRIIAHKVENQFIEKFRNDEKCLNQHLDHKFGTYGEESRAKIGAANAVSQLGKHHTDNTKSKIGAAQRGKHLSYETRAKLSAANRGKHLSYETRAKLSAVHLGKHHTDNTRAKMSASHLGIFRGKHWRKNPVTGKREWYD